MPKVGRSLCIRENCKFIILFSSSSLYFVGDSLLNLIDIGSNNVQLGIFHTYRSQFHGNIILLLMGTYLLLTTYTMYAITMYICGSSWLPIWKIKGIIGNGQLSNRNALENKLWWSFYLKYLSFWQLVLYHALFSNYQIHGGIVST